jgi:hypothetical protein
MAGPETGTLLKLDRHRDGIGVARLKKGDCLIDRAFDLTDMMYRK